MTPVINFTTELSTMRHLLSAIFFITLIFSHMSVARNVDDNLLWVTDNWPGITDNDEALYSTLFQEIFTSQGFKLNKTFVPFKRAVAFVNQHEVDFAGGITKEYTPSSSHIQAPFAVLATPVLAFYKKTTITETLLGLEMLRRYRVVSSPQLGKSIGLEDVYEVTNKSQAFLMVVNGRADVYIDNKGELNGTVSKYAHLASNYDEDQYKTSMVGFSSWYMISPKSSRGDAVMKAYIKGSIELLQSGRLAEIYESRGFIVPAELISYAVDLNASKQD